MSKGRHGVVCGKGINDMEYGWASTSEWNHRVYKLWHSIINRCYDKKVHERQPAYKDCYVCERWLYLSNFIQDIKLIPNYEYWLNNPKQKISLDKDIKSNGQNKEYCLEQCQFVSMSENTRQMLKTRDNAYLKGENNPMYGRTGENNPRSVLIDRFTLDGQYIDTDYAMSYERVYGFRRQHIYSCCKGKIKMHKGFIFKYHEDDK